MGNIARWDGEKWHPLGSGMSDRVRALAVFRDELIAGGAFTRAGGVAATYLAIWDGTEWRAIQ